MPQASRPTDSNERQIRARHALAAVLLQHQTRLWPRFLACYSRLQQLPRRLRRRLARKAAVSLAGAALLLALGRAPGSNHIAHAASIDVDGTICTLVNAIRSANTNSSVGGCAQGEPGNDTIYLLADVTLTKSLNVYYESETGLPLVTSEITIMGNGRTITRDTSSEKFRLFAVGSSGNLTLNNVTLSGGYAYLKEGSGPSYSYTGHGGAIYSSGTVTTNNSYITGNEARVNGGGIYNLEGSVSLNGGSLDNNTAGRDGGGVYNEEGTVDLSGVHVAYNYSGDDGGAIVSDGSLTISDSYFHENTTDFRGGAIYADDGTMTITNTTFSANSTLDDDGGALYIDAAEAEIYDSTFTGNIADRSGGAIFNWGAGQLTIYNSNFSGNIANGDGGAIYSQGTLEIYDSIFSGNEVIEGGGVGGGLQIENGYATITNSMISGNKAALGDGGGLGIEDGNVTITNSTISGNEAIYAGGLYIEDGDVTITNSTISGNEAFYAGGLSIGAGTTTIINTTITGNSIDRHGGGIDIFSGTLRLERSIVSGNNASSGSEIFVHLDPVVYSDAHNLFGHSGQDNSDAFYNFSPSGSDINATSDGTPYALTAILDTTLAANGGPLSGAPGLEEPMLTHGLVPGSPAVDAAPSADCDSEPINGFDQRGRPRNVDSDGNDPGGDFECDIGAFEGFVSRAIYMTAAGPGIADSVAFGKEDILEIRELDSGDWELFFDGSAAGLTAKHDINAIHVNAADDLYLSFFQNKIKTADLGPVLGQDILHYDGSDFTLFFDGSDVGLTTTAEKLDALHIIEDDSNLPGGGSCDAYLLISTLGTGKVPAAGSGQLKFQGEDILGFCMTNSGDNTAGFWYMVLDGSAEGMPKNSTDSISASADGSVIYLTTQAAFNVDSAFGGHSMVYEYDTSTNEFSGPHFSAPVNGLNQKVDGLHIEGNLP